jgi:hypothetical protein
MFSKIKMWMPLVCVAGILLTTGCANLRNKAEALKNKIQEVNSAKTASNSNAPQNANNNANENLDNAQAEADKACASHITFFEGAESGKVASVNASKISADRGFYSVDIPQIAKDGHNWTYIYALPSKNATYGVLVAVETNWDSEDINCLALIEKFKKRDSQAKVAHFWDSGDIPQPDFEKAMTNTVILGNPSTVNGGYPASLNEAEYKEMTFAPRAYGLQNQKLEANPNTKAFARKIGFVLTGKNYQVIINENSLTTVGASLVNQSPVTGISQVHFGVNWVKGNVSLVLEDTAQMAAYRKLFREHVEKIKAEEKEAARTRQEKNLNF